MSDKYRITVEVTHTLHFDYEADEFDASDVQGWLDREWPDIATAGADQDDGCTDVSVVSVTRIGDLDV